MISKLIHIVNRIQIHSDQPWFIPALMFLAAIDLFVAFIPTDALLISSVLLRPKRWIVLFLAVSIGSSLGALALAALFHYFGDAVLSWINIHPHENPKWEQSVQYLLQYRWQAITLIAASPFPQQPTVAMAGYLGMKLPEIFFAVLIGRALKYSIFAWIASHTPKTLMKIPFLKKELEEFSKVT